MVPVAPEPPPTVPLLAPPPLPPPDWASSAVPIVSARAIVSEKICLFIAVPPLSSFLKRDSPEGASGGDVPPLSSISCCNGGAIQGRKSRKRHAGQALEPARLSSGDQPLALGCGLRRSGRRKSTSAMGITSTSPYFFFRASANLEALPTSTAVICSGWMLVSAKRFTSAAPTLEMRSL